MLVLVISSECVNIELYYTEWGQASVPAYETVLPLCCFLKGDNKLTYYKQARRPAPTHPYRYP